MKATFSLLLALIAVLFPSFAFANECACCCISAKELLIYGCSIGGISVAGCWYFCRRYCLRIKCDCECNCDISAEVTDIKDTLSAELQKVIDEIQLQNKEI